MHKATDSKSLRSSDADKGHLEDWEHLLRIIRARTNGVIQRMHVGVYISGRTGTSKTWTVRQTLDESSRSYQYPNCRVSPGGLYDAMQQNPEDVFLLDDVSTLYRHPQGLQVLLAALNGPADQPRRITYTLKGHRKEPSFDFLGGVIAISNKPLDRDPVADAVASRVRVLQHEPTDEMVAAFMRLQALRGFEDLTANDCIDIVEWVIKHSKRCEYRLDLRHMEQGYQDFRLWKHGQSFGVHWQELIASGMNSLVERDRIADAPITKKDEIELQWDKVREALSLFPNNRPKQIEHTGLKTRTFDRRLRELKRWNGLPNCHFARLPVGIEVTTDKSCGRVGPPSR